MLLFGGVAPPDVSPEETVGACILSSMEIPILRIVRDTSGRNDLTKRGETMSEEEVIYGDS